MTTNLQDNGFAIAVQKYFPGLHGARRKFLELVIPGMVKASSVTLSKIACAIGGSSQIDSIVRRLQRFLAVNPLDQQRVAFFIINMLGICGAMDIAIDRTNWKLGKVPINILMLSVRWKSKAVPLFWILLDKEGNSSQNERIDLLQLFLDTFSADLINSLTADREFIGRDWFEWLLNKEIPFYIRIKSNTEVARRGKTKAAKDLFKAVKPGRIRRKRGIFTVFGCDVHLSGGPAKDKKGEDDFFIIASSLDGPDAAKTYALRWRIEQLFKELKSSGFQLEETHLTKPDRLSALLALLAIAFCWILKVGQDQAEKEPRLVRKCKHGRPRRSITRIGFDTIRKAFWSHEKRDINTLLNFVSCT